MGIAAGWAGYATLTQPTTAWHLRIFALITAVAIAQTEISRRLERQRRSLADGPHVNMVSVWLLPAGVLLPAQLVALLSVTLYVYLAFRSWSGTRPGEAHRVAANITTATLSGCAAGLVVVASPGLTVVTVGAAALVHFTVNTLLTGLGLYLANPAKASVESCLGGMDDNLLELATLCVGGLLVMVLTQEPLLAVLVILPLYVLQRSVLIKRLEELATTDQKTQLLNATTWQEGAQREISRAERETGSFGTLMIDLDHFKHINDTYGHLAGDDVLKAVAAVVKQETRAHDLVGRFGGEEFVALLPSTSKEDAIVTAERIRQRISELVVPTLTNEGKSVTIERRTASIGVAAFPLDGVSIEEVMAAADAAVYAAKDGGRNRVVGSVPVPALAAVA
ncbi:GGDEF domain-containing protein [Amycolatopsis jejuensis]|uniref:GGDEF domain-containing protein n=1 Tax=Amycolatopsis jejuensis TaxID=330084 RepID=UPI00052652C1|nr:GGDEF domain-containing protein [Amycolatopsis jejuensis]